MILLRRRRIYGNILPMPSHHRRPLAAFAVLFVVTLGHLMVRF